MFFFEFVTNLFRVCNEFVSSSSSVIDLFRFIGI